MQIMRNHVSPENWMRQVFSAKAAQEGGVVRHKVADVHRIVGCLNFETEVRRRGFRAVQNGQDYVVFCNSEALRLIE